MGKIFKEKCFYIKMEEKKKINKNIIISIILLSIILVSFIYYGLIKPNYPKFENLQECKLYYWDKCGLEYFEDRTKMCYQLEDNEKEIWKDCQIVSEKTKDCYEKNYNECLKKGLY